MNTIKMPALSEDGWVDYAGSQADYMMSHFFLSDYSQSYIYNGFVSSFAYILEESQNDYSRCQMLLSNTLENYFLRYFPQVSIECNVKESTNNPSIGEVYLYLSFTDYEGREYNLQKLITFQNNKVKEVIDINNYDNTLPTQIL